MNLKTFLAGTALTGMTLIGSATAQDQVSVAAISGYFAQGFGISIVDGLNRARDELGINLQIVDTGNRSLDYQEQFTNLAQSGQYDIIFVMGWELVDALLQAQKAFPDQTFVFIDGVLDDPNMTYIDFVEAEGSFLAGTLAGLLSKNDVPGFDSSDMVGFVGGSDIPVIRNFLVGYEAGVAHVGEVRVNSVFAGTFDDPARGSELAMTLYGMGVDVVYQAAGPTGEGVMQAAAAAGKYAIGVDIDQCPAAPGNVLASVLKRADLAVFDLVSDYIEHGALEAGALEHDVASGAVELKICEDVRDQIPEAILAEVETVRQGIADGSIVVPRNE